jgi:hypothetical protein
MGKQKPSSQNKSGHRGKIKPTRPSLDNYRREPQALTPHAERLLRAATASTGTATESLSCDECEARLEFYVDAERRGEPVDRTFHAVWEHLRTCPSCQTSYQLLKAGLEVDAVPDAGAERSSSRSLPFLASRSADGLWYKHAGSRLLGGPIRFDYHFQAAYVQQRLSQSQPATLGLRGEVLKPGKRAMIVTDPISLGDRNVVVEISAERLPDPNLVRLEIELTSSIALPERLWVHLRWNDFVHTDVMQGNRYTFDRLPAAAMEGKEGLHVEFQAEDEAAMGVERQGGGEAA